MSALVFVCAVALQSELLQSHNINVRCVLYCNSYHRCLDVLMKCIYLQDTLLIHLGASDSECVLIGTVSALWSGASCHRNWRSSSIGEDILSW